MLLNVDIYGTTSRWRIKRADTRAKKEYAKAIDAYNQIRRLSWSQEQLMYLSNQVGANVGMLIAGNAKNTNFPK